MADFCLIPARPSPADIEAALPTLSTIRRFNRRFAFVATTTRFVLRFVGEDLRTQILAELRKCISAKASCGVVALELEEQAAQLIDQIEHLARCRKPLTPRVTRVGAVV